MASKKKGNRRNQGENNDQFCSLYVEADSDDEFAQEYFMLPHEPSKTKTKKLPEAAKCHSRDQVKSECITDQYSGDKESRSVEESDDDDSEDIDYKVQFILSSQIATAKEWTHICLKMDTLEVTRGSVLKQPDEEFFDESPTLIEKYLIKWQHASYIHLSWETESDLIDLCGITVKNVIKKFKYRQLLKIDMFEDLRVGECFPPQFLHIDRVLDVADASSINPLLVDWKYAKIPIAVDKAAVTPFKNVAPSARQGLDVSGDGHPQSVAATHPSNSFGYYADTEDKFDVARERDVLDVNDLTSDTDSLLPNGQLIKLETKKFQKKTADDFLHTTECWLTIKWVNQSYSEITNEHIQDIRYAGIDYEQHMREFYRREQRLPGKGREATCVRSLACATSVLESNQPPQFSMGLSLRDYQWDGVRWMLFNWSQKRNSILADEMGLGKTIQTAAFLQMLKTYQHLPGPFLVIAPLSTIVNWQREFNSWTNLDCVIYHGSTDDRNIIRKMEFWYMKNQYKKSEGVKVEVVIATPETCMLIENKGNRSKNELAKINWEFVVIDEAHKLKNYESKFTTTLRNEYTYRNSLLLTGTPLQNNTDELWSLLNFIDRDQFTDREQFIEEFGTLKTHEQLQSLHQKLKPYLLRREKDLVEKTVPPKEEHLVEIELTVPQKQYYRAIYEQNTRFLFRGEAKDGPRLCNLAMELRKCCNHPFLIKGAEKVLAEHFVGDTPVDIMVKASGKMAFLDKLLPKLQEDGHRVLIFSQFRIMLDIIEDYMILRGYSYERVDGAVTGKKRQAAIDRYSTTAPHDAHHIFAMLLSTRAGGVGINLTAADTVIIFDSDWNPQNDLQAMARAHRIGQLKPVKVYRLLMRKSYEMVMFKAASLKLGLDYAVMHNMNNSHVLDDCQPLLALVPSKQHSLDNSTGSSTKYHKKGKNKNQVEGISLERVEHYSSLNKKELENLLKHGAYDIFREEKDGLSAQESINYFEDDIDQILKRSAVVLHDDRGKATFERAGASFSKAAFVSSISSTGAADNIALDDPDFWTKIVGLASTEVEQSTGHKKRKCVNEVSYKDPGTSEFKLNNKLSQDSECESERAIKPAEWNDATCAKLMNSLASRGYGNWAFIRSDAKLNWSDCDIKYGCDLIILMLIKSASTAIKSDANTEVEKENGAISNQANEKMSIDLKYLETIILKNQLCQVSLASIGNKRSHGHETSTETKTNSWILDRLVADTLKSLDHLFIDTSMTGEEENGINHAHTLKLFYDQLDQSLFTAMESKIQTTVELSACTGDNLLIFIESIELPEYFIKMAPKSRQVARTKLSLMEDMFDLQIAVILQHMTSEPSTLLPREPMSGTDNTAADFIDPTINSALNETIRCLFRDLFSSLKSPEFWSAVLDGQLLDTIYQIGWPEGKRKMHAITERLFPFLTTNSPLIPTEHCGEFKPVDKLVENEAIFSAVTIGSGVTTNRPDDVVPNSQDELSSFFMDGKFFLKRTKQLLQLIRDVVKPAEKVVETESTEVKENRKFAHSIITALMKYGRPRRVYDDVRDIIQTKLNILVTQCGDKRKIANFTTTAPHDEFHDASKYLLSWKEFVAIVGLNGENAEDMTRVQAAVKELCAHGEEIFAAQTNEKAGNDGIVQEGQEQDLKTPSKVVSGGLYARVSHKMIEQCMERCHMFHRIRMLAALQGVDNYFQYRSYVKRTFKSAGPNTPKSKRDQSLPYWWTSQYDINLILAFLEQIMVADQPSLVEYRMTTEIVDCATTAQQMENHEEISSPEILQNGLPEDPTVIDRETRNNGQQDRDHKIDWKRICENPFFSVNLSTFRAPLKQPGVEWNDALLPKVAEKRLSVLLTSADVFFQPTGPSVCGSPDVVKKREVMSKNKKTTHMAPTLVYGVRPSWVTNMLSSSTVTTAKLDVALVKLDELVEEVQIIDCVEPVHDEKRLKICEISKTTDSQEFDSEPAPITIDLSAVTPCTPVVTNSHAVVDFSCNDGATTGLSTDNNESNDKRKHTLLDNDDTSNIDRLVSQVTQAGPQDASPKPDMLEKSNRLSIAEMAANINARSILSSTIIADVNAAQAAAANALKKSKSDKNEKSSKSTKMSKVVPPPLMKSGAILSFFKKAV